jgi:hypothetical protein
VYSGNRNEHIALPALSLGNSFLTLGRDNYGLTLLKLSKVKVKIIL